VSSSPTIPRKRRTRQHIIAAQSVNYVERFIIDEGHTAQRWEADYGYDLFVQTYDKDGYVEPGSIRMQLKASETLHRVGNRYVFDLDRRDYNLWNLELMPVILVLFDASKRRAYWVHVQGYFQASDMGKPARNAKSVRIRVPVRQPVNHRAIVQLRELKQQTQVRLRRRFGHA
jgi:hypothetical protein